jgi:hypothetical protein
MGQKAGKHIYLHQLNDTAISEGLQLYNQIWNLTISNGTLNAISSNAFSGLRFRFSTMMIGML